MDISTVVSPVDAEKLNNMLKEINYPSQKRLKLYFGFKNGFKLHYQGDKKVKHVSKNLRLFVGNKIILWNKVMKEVKEKRYAGPFETPPFEYYIQSPVGLVPKDNGKDTRLIFHLSHPRISPEQSVNANIPRDLCKVKYADFDEAVQMCIKAGCGCAIAKSDLKSAFRHLGMRVVDFAGSFSKLNLQSTGRSIFSLINV